MEFYSPNRKNINCFKKNKIKKSNDDGILINRVEKNQIVFEIKTSKSKKTIASRRKKKSFANKLKDIFYNRLKAFFDYEENVFAK